ncbi:MAG: IS1634 family transposase [Verrucomicrobia bacterium]|nr:IS1634 family transposase [Verrucomicrobiota bacterium]
MFIAEVRSKGKQGKSYTSILLRESFRVGSAVKSKTLAVLTHLPAHVLDAVRRALAQPADSLAQLADTSQGALRLRQGLSFGALWAVDQVAQKLGIMKALGVTREAQLSYWQVLARVLCPRTSLLAMVRLATRCAAPALLGWQRAFTEDDLYANGAWLEGRHALIERRLWHARPSPPKDQLFLYDVTSSYLEGDANALAAWGYNRDHKAGKKQIVVGLLTDSQGEAVSIQVYPGNTRDLKTFDRQVHTIKKELGCQGVTLVGDRGMIRADQKAAAQKAQFHFITALTKPQIEKLLAEKVLQLELFDEQVQEVLGQEGRRFVLRRNPVRQAELQRAREHKQQALEVALQKANRYLDEHPRAQVATQQRQLAARLETLNVAEWLKLEVSEQRLLLTRDTAALEATAQLDGCYVVETDLKRAQADAQTIHDRYKDLALVERDFRTLKTGHLEFRPWFVCTEDNTQAHALTAMLALKVRRHLEQAWWSLDVTVEEGLRELEQLGVMELVHPQSAKVVARQVPEPSARQQQLLEALKVVLPTTVPQPKSP